MVAYKDNATNPKKAVLSKSIWSLLQGLLGFIQRYDCKRKAEKIEGRPKDINSNTILKIILKGIIFYQTIDEAINKPKKVPT